MDISKIKQSLENIDSGLKKYIDIMNSLSNTNVSFDKGFQKKFNSFYRIRQRKPDFYDCYYDLLESSKGKAITFEEVILHMYNQLGRVEASFSSKLVATLNPDKPVWDMYVLQNLGLKAPYQADKNRLSKIIKLYDDMCDWYTEYLLREETIEVLKMFDKMYPDAHISNVKKIDLILWQMR